MRCASLSNLSQSTFPCVFVSIDANMRSGSGIPAFIRPSMRTHRWEVSVPSIGISARSRTVDLPPSAPIKYLLETMYQRIVRPALLAVTDLPSDMHLPMKYVGCGHSHIVSVCWYVTDFMSLKLPSIVHFFSTFTSVPGDENILRCFLSNICNVAMKATLHVCKHRLPRVADLSASVLIHGIRFAYERSPDYFLSNSHLL